MADLIERATDGPVALVVLNRPERHNSLVPALLTDLRDNLLEVASDPQVRAVVLAANGRSFSTGGDVGGFHAAGDDVAVYAAEVVGLLNETMLTMMQLPVPVIAAIHGMVTGGSLGLVLAADIVLVAPEATFTPWYTVVGFSPDGGWTAMLPDIVGQHRTESLLLENGTMTADDAVAWGMAQRVVPSAAIRREAVGLGRTIAQRDAGAVTAAKQLVRGDLVGIANRLEAERRAFVSQIVTPQAQEGMARFLASERRS